MQTVTAKRELPVLEAVIFDFDGTIAETERLGHRVAYNRAFAQLGLDWSWDEALYGELLAIGGGKERIAHYIQRYEPPHVPPTGRAAFIQQLHERKQRIFSTLIPSLHVRPGVRRLVQAARTAGLQVAIATTAARTGVDALIAADPELHDAFTFIGAGDIVPLKKPAPDIYTYVIERLGTPAGNCIAVEDSAIGLRAGCDAGIVTLVTVSDYTRDENFAGAAAVLSDLGEPGAPSRTLAGPAPRSGIVDLAYLRGLLAPK